VKHLSHRIPCPPFGFQKTDKSRELCLSSRIIDAGMVGLRPLVSFGAALSAVKSLSPNSRRVGNAVRPVPRALDAQAAEPAAAADAHALAAEPQAVRHPMNLVRWRRLAVACFLGAFGCSTAPPCDHPVQTDVPLKPPFNLPLGFWQNHSEGYVILEVTVGKDGRVSSPNVIKSSGSDYSAIAVDNVLRWRYSPLICNGVPRSFYLTVTIRFTKDGSGAQKPAA
jgi:TonB family protein